MDSQFAFGLTDKIFGLSWIDSTSKAHYMVSCRCWYQYKKELTTYMHKELTFHGDKILLITFIDQKTAHYFLLKKKRYSFSKESCRSINLSNDSLLDSKLYAVHMIYDLFCIYILTYTLILICIK